MKNFLFAFIGFVLISFTSQRVVSFVPQIRVDFIGELQLGENYHKNQKFVLIGNQRDYYFAGEQWFLNDTKQYEPKGADVGYFSDYFTERVITTNNVFHVIFTFIDNPIRYTENQKVHWVVHNKFKNILGKKCQMATTDLYGRSWEVYFSPAYQQQIGPYKFAGLPGLILEVNDTKGDYHFKAFKISRYDKPFKFNTGAIKNFTKSNYLKAKFNLEYNGAGYPPMFGEMKQEYDETSKVLQKMYNNPIELKP